MGFDEPRSGEFFKPETHKNAHAFLIETKRDAPKSPGYKGALKDAVYADITVFTTQADLAEGATPKAYKNVRIDSPLLQRAMREEIGIPGESVRVLGTWKPADREGKASWVWKYADEDVRKAVIAWYDAREGAAEAARAELAAMLED